jgi:hypothetical protein
MVGVLLGTGGKRSMAGVEGMCNSTETGGSATELSSHRRLARGADVPADVEKGGAALLALSR